MSGEADTLLTSAVPRTLESKSRLFGLELSDVLILLLNLSAENLIFGETALKIPMVFGTSLMLGGLMFFFKRGKPDHYIEHYVQYVISPTVCFSNIEDSRYVPFKNGGER